MKLASKIVLMCLIAMMAMSALFSYLTIRRNAQFFTEEHSRIAEELAESLRPRLSQAWKHGGHDECVATVSASSVVFQHLSVRYVLPGSVDSGMKPSAPKEKLATLFERKSVTVTIADHDGRQEVQTYIPLDADGVLEVTRPMQDADSYVRHTLWNSLFALTAATLLCAGVVVFGGIRLIARPLDLLVEKTRRIGNGDFTKPVQLHGNTELTQLGNAINEMCEQLTAQQATIRAESASRAQAEQQLRHADRLNTVGRLAAGIAHEMGTPLNVVSGRAALIASGRLSNEEVVQSATTIKSEADRITKIIRELLDFARRNTPQRIQADLRDVVEQSVELLTSIASKRRVNIEVDAENGNFEANIDAGQIQQVITNLLMNAVQSIKESGTVNVRLTLVNTQPPDNIEIDSDTFIRIDVNDTGSGIASEDQEHIFEPFFTTKDVGEGTGLGLSISYGIVRDHAGWIDVESTPGAGSRFSVFIPKSK